MTAATEHMRPVDLLLFMVEFDLKTPIDTTDASARVLSELPEFFTQLFHDTQASERDPEHWDLLDFAIQILSDARLSRRISKSRPDVNNCLALLLKTAANSIDLSRFSLLLRYSESIDKSSPVRLDILATGLKTLQGKVRSSLTRLRKVGGRILNSDDHSLLLQLLSRLNGLNDVSLREAIDALLVSLWSALLDNYRYAGVLKLIRGYSFVTMDYANIRMLHEELFLPSFNDKFGVLSATLKAKNAPEITSAFFDALNIGQLCADVEEMVNMESVQAPLSSLLRLLLKLPRGLTTSIIAQLNADQAACLLCACESGELASEFTPAKRKKSFPVGLFNVNRRADEFKQNLPSLLSDRLLTALSEIARSPRGKRGQRLAALLRSRSSRAPFEKTLILTKVEVVWYKFSKDISIECLAEFLAQLNIMEITRVRGWVRSPEALDACKSAVEFAQREPPRPYRDDVEEDYSD